MKPILNMFGVSALQISGDDVIPERGIDHRELIQFVSDLYEFTGRPNIQPNIVTQQGLPTLFHGGRFKSENGTFPILQLAIFINGDAVISSDTDIADKIMDDYLDKLDIHLGYRYAGKSQRRTYVNNAVVEFDEAVTDLFPDVAAICDILTKAIPRNRPFAASRLMFGSGDGPAPGTLNSLELIENADFVIEPRAGEPRERNRYFSSAPTTTRQHLDILRSLEALGKSRSRSRSGN